MEALFIGWLIISLTTALTALVRVYNPTLKKLLTDYPGNKITATLRSKVIAGIACFLFALLFFPLMLAVMMIEDYRQQFILQLAETVSQE